MLKIPRNLTHTPKFTRNLLVKFTPHLLFTALAEHDFFRPPNTLITLIFNKGSRKIYRHIHKKLRFNIKKNYICPLKIVITNFKKAL